MINIDKRVNMNRYFETYRPIIKELFKDFYEHEFDDLIDEKFDNFTFISYFSPDSYISMIDDLQEEISNKYKSKYLEDNGFVVNSNSLDSIFDGKKLVFVFEYIMKKKPNYREYASSIFNLDKDKDDYKEKLKDCLDKIESTKESLMKYKQEYKAELNNYKKYIKIADDCSETLKCRNPKYIKCFIENAWDYLSSKDKKFYKNNIKKFNDEKTLYEYFKELDCNYLYVYPFYQDKMFSKPGLIEYFNSSSEKALKTPNVSRKERSKIIKNRLIYFKVCQHLDNKDLINDDFLSYNNCSEKDLFIEYEDMIKKPEVRAMIPSEEKANKVATVRENTYKVFLCDCFKKLPLYNESMDKLRNARLIDRSTIPFEKEAYNEENWCVSGNFTHPSGDLDDIKSYKSHPILMFCAGVDDELIDFYLLHELNHIIEDRHYVEKVDFKKNTLSVFHECGFDCISSSGMVPGIKKRKYELFSEIINDLITSDIKTFMEERNIKFFSNVKQSSTGTIYHYSEPIVGEFYKRYKKLIWRARKTGDRSGLFNVVGKRNYDDLSDLVNDLNAYFNLSNNNDDIDSVLDKINNGIVDKDVRVYQSFISAGQKVLDKMGENGSKTKIKQ